MGHCDDPPSANGDVVRDGLRDDGATADEVVGAGQDEAGPGELVGAGLARLRSRCWSEDALAALLAVWIKCDVTTSIILKLIIMLLLLETSIRPSNRM